MTNDTQEQQQNIYAAEQIEFAIKLLRIAQHVPISVTSWGRTQKRNDSVGGKPNSKHIRWLAVDCVLESKNNLEALINLCKTNDLKAIMEKDHLHIQAK